MTLKEAVKVCLGKKYADFSTRASRKECGFFSCSTSFCAWSCS